MFNFYFPFKSSNLYLIVVLGPDGCGKTSFIDSMINKNRDKAQHYYSHLYPNLKEKINLNKVFYPYQKKPYSKLISKVKIIYMIIKNILISLTLNSLQTKRKTIIWCDRYVYDIFADPLRYRISKTNFCKNLIKKLVWKPNLILILNPSVKAILSRSNELSKEELIKLNNAYFNLSLFLPEAVLINEDIPIDQILIKCQKSISKILEKDE